ncbi:hypothetical protein GBA52_014534 [Prunus armeniaca]|nr:hypothetical protein GBA52_014534 [Prunus armeniaca]
MCDPHCLPNEWVSNVAQYEAVATFNSADTLSLSLSLNSSHDHIWKPQFFPSHKWQLQVPPTTLLGRSLNISKHGSFIRKPCNQNQQLAMKKPSTKVWRVAAIRDVSVVRIQPWLPSLGKLLLEP